MAPDVSLPCSNYPVTGPYPDQLNPVHTLPLYFSTINLIVSFHLRLGLPSGLFPRKLNYFFFSKGFTSLGFGSDAVVRHLTGVYPKVSGLVV